MRKLGAFVLCVGLSSQAQAYSECFASTAQHYQVSPALLVALAQIETSNRPWIVTKNTNGSRDIGLMGINTIHLKELSRFNVTEEKLLEPCVNIAAAGYLLGKQIRKYGYSWEAIGRYHSGTPKHKMKYVRKVFKKLQEMGVMGGT